MRSLTRTHGSHAPASTPTSFASCPRSVATGSCCTPSTILLHPLLPPVNALHLLPPPAAYRSTVVLHLMPDCFASYIDSVNYPPFRVYVFRFPPIIDLFSILCAFIFCIDLYSWSLHLKLFKGARLKLRPSLLKCCHLLQHWWLLLFMGFQAQIPRACSPSR